MRQIVAIAVAVLCMGVGRMTAAQSLPEERLVHQFLHVEISPDAQRVASVEGDSSKSGGAPTVRDLVIRQARSGAAVTIAMPCGRVPQCWPDSPTWSPDGKRLAFTLRTPGTHARSIYAVSSDGSSLTKLLDFSGTLTIYDPCRMVGWPCSPFKTPPRKSVPRKQGRP
jgi:hypothetical protein